MSLKFFVLFFLLFQLPSIDPVMITAATSGASRSADSDSSDSPKTYDDNVKVQLLSHGHVGGDWVGRYHDTDSGVEFICVDKMGCVLTGRKWTK